MQLDKQAPSSTPKLVSSSTLVYSVDYAFLAVILAFALFNVPRALVYLANHGSGAFQGYLLRSGKRPRTRFFEGKTPSIEKESVETTLPVLESASVSKEPWHFPMHLSLRHPVASWIHLRVFEGYTVLQVILMVGYAVGVFFVAFYQSNLFTDPQRIGWVIASQIPFVYAFGTKNNVVGFLVGVGYEKLNYLHRHVGRLMVIGANVHAIGYIYKWCLAGEMSYKIAQPYVRWGLVTLTCFDFLGFFSIQYIRTKYYNFFFATHAVGFIVTLFAACLHEQACIPFVIAGAAVYGSDRLIRVIKTRYATATLQTIPELGLTRVDIPSLGTGWRPGQHVRLRVLSTSMGLWGMIEAHPFTIASATNTEDGLVLMCKKTGNWTRRLFETAQTTVFGEQGQQPRKMVKVIVEGPYGGMGDTTVPNYSGAMFVVGGSGVTFALSAVQDLVLASDKSRTKVIDVVWSVADPAALETFVPLFNELITRSTYAKLRISVFYTRACAHSFEVPILPPGISLTPGRPKIGKLLNELVACTMSQNNAHGAFVSVCGPVALAQEVARAVGAVDVRSKKAIGGIQFHEETFGW